MEDLNFAGKAILAYGMQESLSIWEYIWDEASLPEE